MYCTYYYVLIVADILPIYEYIKNVRDTINIFIIEDYDFF